MKKIGAMTLNWNGEKFIYPHYKMLTQGGIDKFVMLQGSAPWSDYAKEYNLSDKPDRSEQIVRDNFPQVKIVPAVVNSFGPEVYNQGLDLLRDCDVVLRLDYDMFLTNRDWGRLIKFLRRTNYTNYILHFRTCSINYYYDFKHGVTNARELDSIAVSPKIHFVPILQYPDDEVFIIRWKDFFIHHFRGWKGFGLDKDWINNKTPNHKRVFSNDMVQQTLTGHWLICPEEIQNMFKNSYRHFVMEKLEDNYG